MGLLHNKLATLLCFAFSLIKMENDGKQHHFMHVKDVSFRRRKVKYPNFKKEQLPAPEKFCSHVGICLLWRNELKCRACFK